MYYFLIFIIIIIIVILQKNDEDNFFYSLHNVFYKKVIDPEKIEKINKIIKNKKIIMTIMEIMVETNVKQKEKELKNEILVIDFFSKTFHHH